MFWGWPVLVYVAGGLACWHFPGHAGTDLGMLELLACGNLLRHSGTDLGVLGLACARAGLTVLN